MPAITKTITFTSASDVFAALDSSASEKSHHHVEIKPAATGSFTLKRNAKAVSVAFPANDYVEESIEHFDGVMTGVTGKRAAGTGNCVVVVTSYNDGEKL